MDLILRILEVDTMVHIITPTEYLFSLVANKDLLWLSSRLQLVNRQGCRSMGNQKCLDVRLYIDLPIPGSLHIIRSPTSS
jgi:hypothetical protein